MSIVRYTNKKTGVVSLYESTSHYDPETRQSRPVRKYLGTEDPETGELIPSSGKRGRKKADNNAEKSRKQKAAEQDYKLICEKMKKEMAEKEERIRKLERECQMLSVSLERIRDIISNVPPAKDADNT